MVNKFLPHLRFGAILVLTGIMAGIVGATCQWLLHTIEHLVWGKGGLADHTLIEGAMFTTPQYRFLMLVTAGVVGALSWGLLVFTGTFPRISQAMTGGRMPLVRTIWHAVTQIVIVALGASAGREAAPREITSAFGASIGDAFGLDPQDRKIVVGCAAAAGLAAVYSIPFAGCLFALEIMLVSRAPRAVVAAVIVNAVAVLISSGGDLSHAFYVVPDTLVTPSVFAWAALFAPVLGIAGFLFRRGVRWAESNRPETLRLTWTLPLTFVFVGGLAAFTPTILGNGQASAQTFFFADHYMLPGGLAHLGSLDPRPFEWLGIDVARHFNGAATLGVFWAIVMTLALTMAKTAATLATIRSGAWGGTLTPALAVGAGLSAALALAWIQVWPDSPLATYVVIGAGTFLGVSLNAPLTGTLLILEFTRIGEGIVWPTLMMALIAHATAKFLDAHVKRTTQARAAASAIKN